MTLGMDVVHVWGWGAGCCWSQGLLVHTGRVNGSVSCRQRQALIGVCVCEGRWMPAYGGLRGMAHCEKA